MNIILLSSLDLNPEIPELSLSQASHGFSECPPIITTDQIHVLAEHLLASLDLNPETPELSLSQASHGFSKCPPIITTDQLHVLASTVVLIELAVKSWLYSERDSPHVNNPSTPPL